MHFLYAWLRCWIYRLYCLHHLCCRHLSECIISEFVCSLSAWLIRRVSRRWVLSFLCIWFVLQHDAGHGLLLVRKWILRGQCELDLLYRLPRWLLLQHDSGSHVYALCNRHLLVFSRLYCLLQLCSWVRSKSARLNSLHPLSTWFVLSDRARQHMPSVPCWPVLQCHDCILLLQLRCWFHSASD
jgi:hypothetical protein